MQGVVRRQGFYMCELFAMSSRYPTTVGFPLERLARRGGREGRAAHVGDMRVQREIDQFGQVMRDRGQAMQPVLGDCFDPHLEGEVGNQGAQVGIPGPFAIPIDTTLDLVHPLEDGGYRVAENHLAARFR